MQEEDFKQVLKHLPNGRFGMRISEDMPGINFPKGFSFRLDGRLFVFSPLDEQAQEAMGVKVPEAN